MSEKYKVQVAARTAKGHNYYRVAGLCLSSEQAEKEVDAVQLAILRADKKCVVVGGPVLPSKPSEKPADERDERLQQLGQSHAAQLAKAQALEKENDQLKAKASSLEQQVKAKK